MTDLEALHWLKRMKATVLLDDDGHVCVIVSFGSRRYTLDGLNSLQVDHRDGFAEVTAATLAGATQQALQVWRDRRGAVDGLADLHNTPAINVTSGICAYCGQPTVEHSEMDDFQLARTITCTACNAKTFIKPESTEDARVLGKRN